DVAIASNELSNDRRAAIVLAGGGPVEVVANRIKGGDLGVEVFSATQERSAPRIELRENLFDGQGEAIRVRRTRALRLLRNRFESWGRFAVRLEVEDPGPALLLVEEAGSDFASPGPVGQLFGLRLGSAAEFRKRLRATGSFERDPPVVLPHDKENKALVY